MAYIRVFRLGGKQVYSIIRTGAQCLSSGSRLCLPYLEAPMMSSSALLPRAFQLPRPCAFQLLGPCAFQLLGPCAFQPPGPCALSSTINRIIADSSNCLYSIEAFMPVRKILRIASGNWLYLSYPGAPMMSSSALLPRTFQPPGLWTLCFTTTNCIIVDSSSFLYSIELFGLVNSPENTYFVIFCAQNFENCLFGHVQFEVVLSILRLVLNTLILSASIT